MQNLSKLRDKLKNIPYPKRTFSILFLLGGFISTSSNFLAFNLFFGVSVIFLSIIFEEFNKLEEKKRTKGLLTLGFKVNNYPNIKIIEAAYFKKAIALVDTQASDSESPPVLPQNQEEFRRIGKAYLSLSKKNQLVDKKFEFEDALILLNDTLTADKFSIFKNNKKKLGS